jgi:hypothetical protein
MTGVFFKPLKKIKNTSLYGKEQRLRKRKLRKHSNGEETKNKKTTLMGNGGGEASSGAGRLTAFCLSGND